MNKQNHEEELLKLKGIIHDREMENQHLKELIHKNNKIKINVKNKMGHRKMSTCLSRRISQFNIEPIESNFNSSCQN